MQKSGDTRTFSVDGNDKRMFRWGSYRRSTCSMANAWICTSISAGGILAILGLHKSGELFGEQGVCPRYRLGVRVRRQAEDSSWDLDSPPSRVEAVDGGAAAGGADVVARGPTCFSTRIRLLQLRPCIVLGCLRDGAGHEIAARRGETSFLLLIPASRSKCERKARQF